MSPEGAQPIKAIVYTQFWHHLHLIEKQLMDHGIGVAVLDARMNRDEQARSLDQFKVLEIPTFLINLLPAQDKAVCAHPSHIEKVESSQCQARSGFYMHSIIW